MIRFMQFVFVFLVSLSGVHAQDYGNGDYGVRDARRVGKVQTGVVEDVRVVRLQKEANSAARYAGAAIGAGIAGAAANRHGNYMMTALASTIGGVLGGVVGDRISAEDKVATEMVIALDNGQVIAVTAEGEPEVQPGEKVRIIALNGETRVSRVRF